MFIERAMDKEVDFIFHCTADITGVVTDMHFFVYLPRSIARVWELVLNCAIAILYLSFFTVFRYDALPNELLNLLYVLNIGYILAFCIFVANSVLKWPVTTFLHSVQHHYFTPKWASCAIRGQNAHPLGWNAHPWVSCPAILIKVGSNIFNNSNFNE